METAVRDDEAAPVARRVGPVRYEYKVLTAADKAFSGKADAASIERALNWYADRGWRVCEVAAASFSTMLGGRDEVIVVLERESRD